MPKKEHLKDNEFVILLVMSTIVGIVSGYAAVLCRYLIFAIEDLLYPGHTGSETMLTRFTQAAAWWKVLIPAVVIFIVAWIVWRFAREAKGHGVPEVMESVALKGGIIRPRVVFVKAIASALTIGAGGSAGQEGPIVQIGAAAGSTIGQWFKVSRDNLRTLVGCGAAAGIAATFNAPLAGCLFALEVVLRNFSPRILSPIVVSSVISTVVSYHHFSKEPIFKVPAYTMEHNVEILFYLLLGLIIGFAAVGFIRVLYRLEDVSDRMKFWPPLQGFIGGGSVGLIAIFFPQVLGNGYDTIESSLHGSGVWYLLLLYFVLKLFATSFTLSFGGSGGIFAPSLFMGATLGGAFGSIVHSLFPMHTATPGAYAMVGMGAMVAGTTHGPIAAIMILYEMTRDYHIVLPLMLACIIATTISARVQKDSIYTLKLKRRGVNLNLKESERVLQTLHVSDVMHRAWFTVPAGMPARDFMDLMLERNENAYYVIGQNDDRFHGAVTIHDLPRLLSFDGDFNLLVVEDLLNERMTPVQSDEFLVNVLPRFEFDCVEEIPVVSIHQKDKLVGVLSRRDIIESYDHEILRRSMRDLRFIDTTPQLDIPEAVHIPETHQLEELAVPHELAGKSLKQTDLRARFGITVVAVKRLVKDKDDELQETFDIPTGDTVLDVDDRLLVVVTDDSLDRFFNWLRGENGSAAKPPADGAASFQTGSPEKIG